MNKKQVFRKIGELIGRAIFCVCLCLCTLAAKAQDNLLTVKLDKVPLSKAISAIEGQSRYLFMLGGGIDASAQIVSVNAEKQSLRVILDQLVRGTEFMYSIEGQNILLAKKAPKTAIQVSGRVLDSHGMPVIGAAVLVKGTTIGTSTDTNGAYSLQIPPPPRLKMLC